MTPTPGTCSPADASAYSVEPAAVAFPRTADDVSAAVRICAERGVPIVARGGGTSLAGQTAGGRGLVLDFSRHMNAIERSIRTRAGCACSRASCRRTSTARPSGSGWVRAGHVHVEPGDARRHDRQQLERVGVDRARHDDRSRPRAGGRAGRRVAGDVLARRRRIASTSRCGRCSREHARAIAEDYPKHWRQSGGYRLDRMDPFDLSKLVVGSEGHARDRHRGDGPAGGAAEDEDVLGRALRVGGARHRGHAGCARPEAVVGRDDRPHDPVLVALQARVPQARGPPGRRPGRAAVRRVRRRHAGRGAREAGRARRGVGRARPRLPRAARRVHGRAGRAHEGAQGRARPADGR